MEGKYTEGGVETILEWIGDETYWFDGICVGGKNEFDIGGVVESCDVANGGVRDNWESVNGGVDDKCDSVSGGVDDK